MPSTYIPLPATPTWASERSQALRRQLELSQLHRELVWTDPVTGESGKGLAALLWRIRQIQTDNKMPLVDVSEVEYRTLVKETEGWIK